MSSSKIRRPRQVGELLRSPYLTQLQRATAARQRLLDLFPQIAEAKEELQRVVDEAQNRPPEGLADGTIDEVRWKQLSSVVRGVNNLLVALLFWGDM
jgi:hypothetical protein